MKYQKLFFTIAFSVILFFVKGQDIISEEKSNTFYIVTTGFAVGMGPGIGKSFPTNAANIGLGLNVDFALQKNKWLYSIGYRVISDFQIVNTTKGKNNVQTTEITFGKSLKNNLLSINISSGISRVVYKKQDALIKEYTQGSGLFNIYREYSMYKENYIGVPISLKLFLLPLKYYGVGLEFYANINKGSNYFSINLSSQFGKLRNSLKQKKKI
jgi:hypothetical protein